MRRFLEIRFALCALQRIIVTTGSRNPDFKKAPILYENKTGPSKWSFNLFSSNLVASLID